MDIGKLFGDAWGLFTKDIGPLMVGMLIAFCIPALIVGVLLAATILPSLSGFSVDSSGQVTSVSGSSLALIIVGSVLAVFASVLVSIPLYAGILKGVLRRVREGREMGYGDAFGGFRLFGKVVTAALLLVVIFLAIELVPVALILAAVLARSWILGALAAVVMVVAIVAMIYLQISWVYLFPLIVDREGGVVAALGESRRLVHGTGWWMTFAALLVLYLAVLGASFVLGLVPFVGGLAAAIVVYPFMLTYLTSMYFRARGEGALVDAAIVPAGAPPQSQTATPYTPTAAPAAPPPVPAPPVALPPVEQAPQYAPAPAPLSPAAHEVPPAEPAAPEAPAAPPPPGTNT